MKAKEGGKKEGEEGREGRKQGREGGKEGGEHLYLLQSSLFMSTFSYSCFYLYLSKQPPPPYTHPSTQHPAINCSSISLQNIYRRVYDPVHLSFFV